MPSTPLRRFLVPRALVIEQTAILPADQAHHLIHVLRIRAGQEIEIFDGEGRAYTGIVEIRGAEAQATRLVPIPSGARSRTRFVVLAAALIKGDKFEWIIQKATELGVDEFVPLETRRCNVKIPEARRSARIGRWRAIAEEAAKQCRRDSVPIIREIYSYRDFLSSNPFAGFAGYICYEQSATPWRQEFLLPRQAVLCIGPEGGWDPEEIELAAKAGFRDFSLGPRTLRSETAALAALTLFQLDLSSSGLSIGDPLR